VAGDLAVGDSAADANDHAAIINANRSH
jgi:hypothetical protein